MNDDLHALIGAYATDALDDEERSGFEAHLSGCAACAEELAGFHEVLAALAGSRGVRPPAQVEDLVVAAAVGAPAPGEAGPGDPGWGDPGSGHPGSGDARQVPGSGPAPAPAVLAGAAAARGSRRSRLRATFGLAAAAAALFAAGALLGRSTAPQAQVAQPAGDPMDAILAVAAAPDAAFLPLDVMGTGSRVVISQEMGKVAFLADDLPTPAKGLCYQVWRVAPDGTKTSAGVFTPDAQGHVAVVLEAGAPGDSLVITTEPPGGSPRPTGQMVGQLDA